MAGNRIIALDYGRVHTGVAISDPSGTIVRPLDAIRDAATPEGLKQVSAVIEREEAGAVVVGMPVSLSGERGAQAAETGAFISALSASINVPVFSWDERFTSKLAAEKGRLSGSNPHSLAACCLLEDYLGSSEYRRGRGGE